MIFQPVYAFSPGSNHIPFLKPVIQSILRNCSGRIKPHFCILLPGKLKDISIDADCTFKIMGDDDHRICNDHYFKEGRADIPPFATYSQLMIPRYFSSFSKILFLEVDQIIQRNLDSLWQHVYEKNIKLGAVRSIDGKTGALNSDCPDPHYAARYPHAKYYNTGVFLFDTQHWLELDLEGKCLSCAREQIKSQGHTYKYYAQGAMNCALHQDITDLEPVYNWTGLGYKIDIPSEMLDRAAILHWNGSRKPWLSDGLYSSYYLEASGLSEKEIACLRDLSMASNLANGKNSEPGRLRRFLAKLRRD
jgi:hypothetical protein